MLTMYELNYNDELNSICEHYLVTIGFYKDALDMKSLCKDLTDEYDALDELVTPLSHEDWRRVTPFFGWTVKEQISHLAYFDRAARISIQGRDAFEAHMAELLKHASTYDEIFDFANSEGVAMADGELLAWWRHERKELAAAFKTLEPGHRLPWYGPSMSARSSATARLMETWAHGQDIADALGIVRKGTQRLKHIVHLGYSTLAWSFMNRGLPVPESKIFLTLESPEHDIWNYGSSDSTDIIGGTALDFCLVVTQRRHVADTALVVQGEAAASWMTVAQAFAGPPENPPAPGLRVWASLNS